MRRLVCAAALLLIGCEARAGALAFPAPGFFMEYRVEAFSEGRRSEERFTLRVEEDLGGERRLLSLSVDSGAVYRAVYSAGPGEAGPFALSRFERVESREEGRWQVLAPEELELLRTLAGMQDRLAAGRAEADSTLRVGGRDWSAQRFALTDSSESTQRSASVTLTRRIVSRGRAWITTALPFGGWLRFEEERVARKVSEIGGRRYVGEPETNREVWTLVAVGAVTPNK